eukprot:6213612-Pleurochrysis_carterae.AAC.2
MLDPMSISCLTPFAMPSKLNDMNFDELWSLRDRRYVGSGVGRRGKGAEEQGRRRASFDRAKSERDLTINIIVSCRPKAKLHKIKRIGEHMMRMRACLYASGGKKCICHTVATSSCADACMRLLELLALQHPVCRCASRQMSKYTPLVHNNVVNVRKRV